jgi:ubiquinone/menaquinone biosynthesis C-methylase UbiE
MASSKRGVPISPARLNEDLWSAWTSLAIVAAVELDLFSVMASGNRTADEIGEATGASAKGVARLLDALTALKYVRKSKDRYSLEPVADTYLVKGRPLFMEGVPEITRGLMMMWTTLAEAVKKGSSAMSGMSEEQARGFFPVLVKQIFPMSFAASEVAIRKMNKKKLARIATVLDIGGGAAAWSIPFARANRKTQVTLIDYPEVTAVARDYARRFSVAERFRYIEGNFFQSDWGTDQYDLAILGHILHGEGVAAAQALLRRAYEALNDHGMLLIAELIPNDQRTGPPLPLLFGLNMLAATKEGDVYTMGEYRRWLKDAGFKRVTTIASSAPSPLILASK